METKLYSKCLNLSPGSELNTLPPKGEASVLSPRQQRLVIPCILVSARN